MIGCSARQLGAHDVGTTHSNSAAAKSLIERHHRQERRKGSKMRRRRGDVLERMIAEGVGGERVPPVVTVADDERGQMSRLAKQVVGQHVLHLPVALALVETEVPMNQV